MAKSHDNRTRGRQRRGGGLVGFVRRNAVYIACAAAVVVAVVLALAIVRMVMPVAGTLNSTSAKSQATSAKESYVSPYDWTKLDRSGGRYRYVVNGEVKSRLGVDVSESQGAIDWNAVASDGIDFAMVRLGYRGTTEGGLYVDEYYWYNIEGARDAGLDVGVYFFSQARTVAEAVEEADFVLEYLGGTPLAYPIAFDSEAVAVGAGVPRTANLTNDEMTAVYEAFRDRIDAAGYHSIVYGNVHDLARYRYASLEQDEVWWAEYGTFQPATNIDIDLWQYSNSGTVAGISTAVDMNIDLMHVLS